MEHEAPRAAPFSSVGGVAALTVSDWIALPPKHQSPMKAIVAGKSRETSDAVDRKALPSNLVIFSGTTMLCIDEDRNPLDGILVRLLK